MSTAKGEETRRRIVWAAWELSSARGIEQLLCGVSLREVAATADMSPSAVTYHYPTMRDLALAMVEELVDSVSPQPAGSVEDAFETADAGSVIDTVHDAATANWTVMTSPDEVVFEQRLLRCYSAVGASRDGAEVQRHLARFNRQWVDRMTAIYQEAVDEVGLRTVEPFDVGDLARIMQVFTEGLLHHWMCDPGSVRADLVADVAAVVASTLVTPKEKVVSLDELRTLLPTDGLDPISWSSDSAVIAAGSIADLFTSGIEHVTLTEVADVLCWRPEQVLERLGPVRRVAALSFARHLPAVDAAAGRRRDADPQLALTDALWELARRVQQDRWCALALLFERLASRAASDGCGSGAEIADLVPLDPIVESLVTAAGDDPQLSGRDRAEVVVDTVLARGATGVDVALSRIIEPAVRMAMPPSAGCGAGVHSSGRGGRG